MPSAARRVIRSERLTAPPEHLGVLVEPGAAWIHGVLRSPPAHQGTLCDTPLTALRRRLRQDLGLTGPVIATGHQPEFYHAGVLAKTIAALALAAAHGGTAVYLTVDSDVPKSPRLTLPQRTAGGLRRIEMVLPMCDARQTYEEQPRVPRTAWLQFFGSLAATHEFNDQSLLPTFARAWLTTEDAAPAYCDAFDRAEAATLAALGIAPVRSLRVSQLCTTPAFRTFAAHLILNAAASAQAYNAAQAAYRIRHDVRARGRPVPPLAERGDAIETPFWLHRPGEARRRLFVTSHGPAITLWADDVRVGDVPVGALQQVEPWPFERDGWRLRPRALALSAFARLLLADLFIHGIGGAKYDELMEEWIAALLGAPPGPACCVSATACLPLPCREVRPADLAGARQRSRDLRCNPQRHVPAVPAELRREWQTLVRRSDELGRNQSADHAARRAVYQALQRVRGQMLAADPWRAAQYDQAIATLTAQWQADRIARDREYFYALHPRATLEQLVQVVRQAVAT